MQPFASTEQAHLAFIEYAQLDERLIRLWELCQLASPPDRTSDEEEEELREIDPAEGWCAELHYFSEFVKPHLTHLVGLDRKQGPAELQTRDAYITIYRALIHHALRRPCECCRERAVH